MAPGPIWQPAYVGLGSNLDDPLRQLELALGQLAALPSTRLVSVSSPYRTTPFGPVAQPDFVNAVAALLTALAPEALLERLRAIELTLGRAPARERWGPRRIDLDLLVQGRERRVGEPLTLPHPGIPERGFVLYPLLEIAPDLEVPGAGVVRQLAAKLPSEGVVRIEWASRT
jgi:2-amino-4-hydroxy-6-hydroxymethyldihydropteridine diphosphokinase